MKILNFERMRRRLAKIPAEVRKQAKADLMLAGREINMLQRSLVPKDQGVLVSTIRTEQLPDPEIGVQLKAGGPRTTKAYVGRSSYEREVTIGQGNNRGIKRGGAHGVSYDYALAQEHGTEDMQANPFFYPAVRVKKNKVQRSVRTGVRRALRKAVKS